MAKDGFKVMDSDIHVLGPHDLWLRYIEPRFKDRAPRFAPIDGSNTDGWQFEGKVFPAFFDRPGRDLPRARGRERREQAQDPLGQLRSALWDCLAGAFTSSSI